MLRHPEQAEDEVFIGNTCTEGGVPSHLVSLRTARLGRVAYTVDGSEKLPADYMRPLFIGKSEQNQFEAIMKRLMRG